MLIQHMRLLIIDTSGPVCGVAVMEDEKVLSEFTAQNRNTHSANLMPMTEAALEAAGKTIGEMDAIAASIIGGTLLTGGVGNVIGSFFGAMILATIQKIIALSPLNASWWQEMANGAMLGFFIMLQSVVLSARAKSRGKLEANQQGHPKKE